MLRDLRVQRTERESRRIVEKARHDFMALCRRLDTVPVDWAIPLDPATTPFPAAALTAYAELHAPAYLLGVQILLTSVGELTADLVVTNWTAGYVTFRLRPADGSTVADTDPRQVAPNSAGSAGLRMSGHGRRRDRGLAVTVELHAHQAQGARFAPYLAFLLPQPGQLPPPGYGQPYQVDEPPGYGLPYDDPYPY